MCECGDEEKRGGCFNPYCGIHKADTVGELKKTATNIMATILTVFFAFLMIWGSLWITAIGFWAIFGLFGVAFDVDRVSSVFQIMTSILYLIIFILAWPFLVTFVVHSGLSIIEKVKAKNA